MKLWLREIVLKVGNKEYLSESSKGGFRIEFDVPFSTSEDPDIFEVSIYNLSNDSVASIKPKTHIILNAGYKGNVGNLLSGKVEEVSSKWDGVDRITTISISDGGFEWRNARIQKTYAKGSTAKYIMQDLSSLLGLEVVEVSPNKDITYQLGVTVSGGVESALKQFVKDTESKMYIDKGRLFIREEGKGTKTGFLLNSDTGLIGSPEKVEEEDKKGNQVVKYNIKCLLNHKISKDSIIRVESRVLAGDFRVESGRHYCSSNDFLTEMVVVPS